MSELSARTEALCVSMGMQLAALRGGDLAVHSPIDGTELARVHSVDPAAADAAVARAQEAFVAWRQVPAPRRGEMVRRYGQALREHKQTLGELVTIECGKILQEGLGEVQEMIDICDFAVGLSRQLYGLTIASERPGHRMMETWHPLGPVAVISAFNFPVAVWSWNAAIAWVCGNPTLWKPSDKTPLTALACQALWRKVAAETEGVPEHLSQVLPGAADVGEALARDTRIPLVSATGSCRMGRAVAPVVAARLGRYLLELGGNNGMLVAASADLELAVRAIVFSAVGTAGQRCTSLRRLFVHRDIEGPLMERLASAFAEVPVGDPLRDGTLMGPLIDGASAAAMRAALAQAQREGGEVVGGDRVLAEQHPEAFYHRPALVRMPGQSDIVREETFAPILYCMGYDLLDDAIAMHNGVQQGLSSAIFTGDVREAERFMSATGSDCGIANVNIGPSGAEIGGAFGGEKATGGGREAGSDAWRAYMRRATNTINYSSELPLAQGIRFTR